MQRYKKCENKHLHFLFLGKPSKLFDTANPDWIPTLKLGHDKLTINTSKATARRLYTLQTENEMLKVGTKKWSNENDEKVLFYIWIS